MRPNLRSLRSGLIGVGIAVVAWFAMPGQALAATGGYPYASYMGPHSHPAAYEWTDSHGNPISKYGYYYRNCTDFSAWKLATANKFGDYRGFGNGGTWGSRARQRHYTVDMNPKPGSIAWWGPTGGLGKFGHVAWVESVKGNSVTIQEYNYLVPAHPGTYDRRTISRTSVSGYIHFKDLKAATPKPKPKPKPKSTPTPVAVAGTGDSTGFYDPPAAGFHLSNALAPGSSDYIFPKGPPNMVPVVGDWDGDGRDSVGYYDPGPAGWHLSNSLAAGSSDYIFARGKAGTIPVVGDWNGDGRDSTGFYDPGAAGFHLSNALAPGSSDYIFSKGPPNMVPVVGDWDGDGRDSVGYYDPGPAGWHLSNSLAAGSSDYIFARGKAGTIPVVGDWNGDGRDSTGFYDPADQSWHLRNELSDGPSEYIFARGAPGMTPLVGNWDGR